MSTKLYVGNISFDITNQDLNRIFGEYGAVESSNVITDRDTGRSRGFGFVEMTSASDADSAMTGLNGKEVDGRQLKVNEAKPREDRSNGGFSGGQAGYGQKRGVW